MFFRNKKFETMPMQQAMEQLRRNADAHLIDVRTPEEYAQGHLPGSLNWPLDSAAQLRALVPQQDTPLYVYCRSGARSRAACAAFAKQSYTCVTDIGGILAWDGALERGNIV